MGPSHRTPPATSVGRSLVAVGGLLTIRNLLERPLPDVAYVPMNVGLGAVLLVLARRGGCSWENLGLDRSHVRRGLKVGGTVASVAVAAMVAGAALPATQALFDDGRVPVDASPWERLYQTAVRIPVGTVAFEELAFRGVLLALLCRRFSPAAAVVLNSALFGLWHIVPTVGTARANAIVGLGRVGLVVGSVLVTFIGGLIFCALRTRARHLVAPAVLHLAFNDTGYLLAWWTRS